MQAPATPQQFLRKLSRLAPTSAGSSSSSRNASIFAESPSNPAHQSTSSETSQMHVEPTQTESPALRVLFSESAPHQVEALSENGPQIVIMTDEYDIFASEMDRRKNQLPIREYRDESSMEDENMDLSLVEVYEQLAADRFNVLSTDFQLKPLDQFALDAEKQNWELERNTWNLVARLFSLRLLTNFPSEPPLPPSNPYTSDLALLNHHLNSSLQHSSDIAVLQWLQHTAPGPSLREGPDEGRSRWWGSTVDKRRMGGASLDPDAPLREGLALHSADATLDTKMNVALFGMVRRGVLDQVDDMCSAQSASWRAGSLAGGLIYSEEHEEMEVSGNRNRDLWKAMCWEVAQESTYDRYERAVYASMCGDVQNILPVCETWEDHLWAYYTSLTEMTATQVLRQHPLPPLPHPTSDFQTPVLLDPLTPTDIFDRVKRHFAENPLPLSLRGWYRIQECIILNRLPELFSEIAREVSEEEEQARRILQTGQHPRATTAYLHPHMLRFLSHLALIVRQCVDAGLMQWDQLDDLENVILIYAGVMIKANKPVLVASYASQLSAPLQRRIYPTLLESISKPAPIRHAYLELAAKYGMDVKNLAQTVVVNGLQDTVGQRALPASADEIDIRADDILRQAKDADKSVVRLLEWLDWKAGWWAEKIEAINYLMRYWLLQGNLPATRHLLDTHVAKPPPLPTEVRRVDSLDSVTNDHKLLWETTQAFEMAEEKILVEGLVNLAEWRKKMTMRPKGGVRGMELLEENDLIRWKAEVVQSTASVIEKLRSFVLTRFTEVEDAWRKLGQLGLVNEIGILRDAYLPESILWLLEVLYEVRELYPTALEEANKLIEEVNSSNNEQGGSLAEVLKRNRTVASRVSKTHQRPLFGELGWSEASNAEMTYWNIYENWVRLFGTLRAERSKRKGKAQGKGSTG
ncbi:hypothetical protein M427DRAFT_245594 [Gonapodya prolifera JEL478]|uniref:Nuclear pore complex protein n=1 Tax=Gonapodya prolifera (strain JEL478) TaxID=1344416 RepID=A0A139AMH6_GONPJ|nr:hypothetical protein M427DRAFT_245594 [Gonapodya prolifera JEL478]|eukprot:KXS17774.1 hypothetical protein M427DRAFT_245594 [Gonapodya prolifera JEL478]